jgi:hypothetical protein
MNGESRPLAGGLDRGVNSVNQTTDGDRDATPAEQLALPCRPVDADTAGLLELISSDERRQADRAAVEARLVPPARPGRAVLAVVDHCPLCGRPHVHGAGVDLLRPHLGLRVAHCGRGGYELVPAAAA